MNKGQCPNCSEMNLYSNPACNKCGAELPWASAAKSANSTDKPTKNKSMNGVNWGCSIILLVILGFFVAIFNETQQKNQTISQAASRNIEGYDVRQRKTLEDLETTLAKTCFRDRVRDLRLEWEAGKDDPSKSEIIKYKIDSLMRDIESNSC